MENKFTHELIEKAKQAKTAEELTSLAKENGAQLTAEEANTYFAQLHQSGEISDDELDNVAGGGCVQDAFNESVHDLTDAIADAGGISTQGTLTKK